jgi:hypothetical protein
MHHPFGRAGSLSGTANRPGAERHKVQTSAVERNNLTLRELIAPLSRRTWSMAHDVLHLWLHTLWAVTYYNFIRVNMALEVRVRGPASIDYGRPPWLPD